MNCVGISLGNVCYSAEWAVHNGLRKRKEDGYNTCPLIIMVLLNVLKMILNIFVIQNILNYIII